MFMRGSFRYPYIVRLMGAGGMLCLLSVPGLRWAIDGMVRYKINPTLYSISNEWLMIDSYEPPGQLPINNYGVFQFHQDYQFIFVLLFTIQISLFVNVFLFWILRFESIGVSAVYRLVWYCNFTICGMMKIKLMSSGSMEFNVINVIGIVDVRQFKVGNFELLNFIYFFIFCFLFVLCVCVFFVLFYLCEFIVCFYFFV